MQLDALTPGAHFHNITATADGDHIRFSGLYEAGAGLIPAIVFAVGNAPWTMNLDQCIRNVCCLWEIAQTLRDAEMIRALGTQYCDEHVNVSKVDLLKGNSATGRWDVRTTIQPSFIAMLFISITPFFIWHEIAPLEWTPLSVQWNAVWYGQPCHNVLYAGRTVCVNCVNEKPPNADYVFTANWFRTFHCDWTCRTGFKGPNCEIDVALAIGISAGAVGLLAVGLIMFVMRRRWFCCQSSPKGALAAMPEVMVTVVQPPPPPPPLVSRQSTVRSDVITFKDMPNVNEIRIKFH
jgi:hypothetical protein